MKVSVIIPTYNAEKTIGDTLDSVFNQTHKNLEIIIVNDGSTDGTLKLLNSYRDKIKLITIENKGVSNARNIGLNYASGDYIQYLDSDDLLTPQKIEIQLKALKESDADIAYGNWQKFKLEERQEILILETVNREIIGDAEIEVFTDFWCPPAALLYSKRIIEKIGPWKLWLPLIEDARYLLDAIRAEGRLVYTPIITSFYRSHSSGSLSTNNRTLFNECIYKNLKDIYKLWIIENKTSPLHKQALTKVLRYSINVLSGNKLLFEEAIDLLLKIQPNYIPEEKGLLKVLSNLIGYKNAEEIARLKRRFLK
jgi:glycosyltransferase involved in cell wall biosynthesis